MKIVGISPKEFYTNHKQKLVQVGAPALITGVAAYTVQHVAKDAPRAKVLSRLLKAGGAGVVAGAIMALLTADKEKIKTSFLTAKNKVLSISNKNKNNPQKKIDTSVKTTQG